MANDFCRFLSNGYRIKSEGTSLTYQPCCWYKTELNLFDPDFAAKKATISQIQGWVPDCSACRQIEDSGVYGAHSPRLRSFLEIPDGGIPDNVPAWMEITIDITCNAACIMCGPWHSTTWRRQEIKFGIQNAHNPADLVNPLTWLDHVVTMFDLNYVKSVSFLGGEPFDSPIPVAFLQLLKNTHGSLADVTVHFQTNTSLRPAPELIDLMHQCKRIKFGMSLDAVGDRFEYIRYPLKWSRVQDAVAFIQGQNFPSIRYTVLATLTPLNAYYYDEIESWAQSVNLPSVKPNRCIGSLDLNHTPMPLRAAILDKYPQDHPVSKMFSNLEINHDSCIPYIDDLDRKRKQNWRTTFPEIVKYFEYGK